MNKLELVTALKDKTGVSKVEAAKIVKTFFDIMADTLATGERVEVRGLCRALFGYEIPGKIGTIHLRDFRYRTAAGLARVAPAITRFHEGKLGKN